MKDEEDTQYMQAQDPGYALHMLKLEIEHVGNMVQKEHSESLKQGNLEEYLAKLEWEEEIRREELYWADRDEWYPMEDEK